MPRIKIDAADKWFSRYVRELQDNTCQRCGNQGEKIQNSHFFGRANEATRFCLENCDAYCYGCHQHFGSTDREAYRQFKVNQLGKNGFKALVAQANSYKKKDRKMEAIKWKAAYLQLCKEKGVTPNLK